ncbi:hypothetical protein M9H77_25546 [Catharanthus roseus]|uniref:Uncharacterized protein n=1 Tax=Catharanthus roseus TaxID=4058 RepID=A0ACC0ABE9_CATRO|nr:hypothetical protein M9H77_25546 [Catharanthus roseus]
MFQNRTPIETLPLYLHHWTPIRLLLPRHYCHLHLQCNSSRESLPILTRPTREHQRLSLKSHQHEHLLRMEHRLEVPHLLESNDDEETIESMLNKSLSSKADSNLLNVSKDEDDEDDVF